jgi:hypothetical protein
VNQQEESSSSELDSSKKSYSRRWVLKSGANLTAGTLALSAFAAPASNAQPASNLSNVSAQSSPAKPTPSEHPWETF